MNLSLLYTVPADYPELWRGWTKRFRGQGSQRRKKVLHMAGRVIVVLFVAMYLLLAIGCLTTTPAAGIGFVLSTAVCFILVSIFRRWRNAPRPYEVFDLKPLLPKSSLEQGRSFPSRHAFSAFLIGTLALIIFRDLLGVLFFVLAIVLGWIRVIEGVHFPRDIFAAAILGIIAGVLCTSVVVSGVA